MKIQDYDNSVHLVKLVHSLNDYTIESIL